MAVKSRSQCFTVMRMVSNGSSRAHSNFAGVERKIDRRPTSKEKTATTTTTPTTKNKTKQMFVRNTYAKENTMIIVRTCVQSQNNADGKVLSACVYVYACACVCALKKEIKACTC